jgi:hypothetical protein
MPFASTMPKSASWLRIMFTTRRRAIVFSE